MWIMHKYYFDKSIWVEQEYRPEDCVFVDIPVGHNSKGNELDQDKLK